jgi:hypothetical protein
MNQIILKKGSSHSLVVKVLSSGPKAGTKASVSFEVNNTDIKNKLSFIIDKKRFHRKARVKIMSDPPCFSDLL